MILWQPYFRKLGTNLLIHFLKIERVIQNAIFDNDGTKKRKVNVQF